MKPGIYLIEVKECEGCRGYGTEVWNDMDVPHKLCNGLGYTETRIDAEEWLLSMLGRIEWTNPTGLMDCLPSTERMEGVRFTTSVPDTRQTQD